MIYNFLRMFLLFILYSTIGYITEIISVSSKEKRLVLSRGYLIGPWIPIYGVGTLLTTTILDKYKKDMIALFIMSIVICIILEYMTSLVMEKIFKLRWWDYSDRKFNINGRVCLENGLIFGFGGILIVKFINPLLISFINSIPMINIYLIGTIILIAFIIDLVESTYIIYKLKINVDKYTNKDSTMELKQDIMKAINKNVTLTSRLIDAFPNIKYTNILKDFNRELKRIKKKRKEGKKSGNKKRYK
ncbi:MAG: putative ABC transporter permease [Bacilli bacterium]|nr:putative ABC transporter permease [Bacilli bacterium]